MIPRDWRLVVWGHTDANRAGQPGSQAPTEADMARLMAEHGAPSASIRPH